MQKTIEYPCRLSAIELLPGWRADISLWFVGNTVHLHIFSSGELLPELV